MSWSIKSIGPLAGVRADVAAQNYLPQGLKDVINGILDNESKSPNPQTGARVESYGHIGTNGSSNVGKFEIELFALAKVPETPAVLATTPVEAKPLATQGDSTLAPDVSPDPAQS